MAYNKVVIDVEARFVDNVTGQVNKADKAVNNLGKKRPKVVIDADNAKADSKINNTGKKIDNLGRKKSRTRLEAEDNASKTIDRVLDRLKRIGDRIFTATVRIRDSAALSTLNKISDTAMSLAGKTFTATMKIKDLALSPLTMIKNTIFSIKGLIAGIFTGIAAKQLVAMPIGLADQYSGAKIGFQTLLGDVSGQKMMDDLDAFAKATPFKTSEVIASTQKMIAMGWSAENIIEDMTTIGDAAAATGKGEEGLNRIVLALAQIKAKGKLSTEELNQLAESGIAAKRYIAEGLGYGTGDEAIMKLSKDLEGGAIAADAAIQAIMSGMKEYEGMMEKTANETVAGLKSQIEDTFEINIFRRWGQGLQDGAKRGLGSVVKLLDTADASLQKVGDMLYEIGQAVSGWTADKLENAVKKIQELVETEEFDNADLPGKIKILWDGVVADPIKEWWNGGGQEKVSETAGKVGKWIGQFISSMWVGIFKGTDALIDNDGVAKEGAGVAESFVRGFLEGFDGQAITDAFVNAIKNVWQVMPTWGKVLLGGVAAGKVAGGIQTVAGGAASLMGGVGALIGTPGTAMVGGTGLSSMFAGLGYTITGGAAGSALSGGAAATIGAGALGGVAGGIYGGYTGYQGVKQIVEGEKESDAVKQTSGLVKVGGVVSGAGAGAAVGTMILPGIGTLIGAGIGAGVGALAGNYGSKKLEEWDAAQKSMTELTETADESAEAAEAMEQRQADAAKFLKNSFGDLAMTLSEIEVLAKNITLGDNATNISQFTEATATAISSFQELKTITAAMNKWNWRASVGFKFSDTDKESYLETVTAYIASAEQVVEDQHYMFTAAVNMLIEPKEGEENSIINNANEYFGGLQEQLNEHETKLTEQVNIALEDGIITADEQKIIADLQSKIDEITNKFAKTQAEAELEAIKIKFSSGELDKDSYEQLQQQLQAQIESSTATYDTALTSSITNLKLQLEDGAIDQAEYDEQIKALTEGYTANVDEIKANAANVQFEILGDAMEDVLGDDAKAKLQSALENSLKDGIDPIDWTPEQAAKYLNTDSLSTQASDAISMSLSNIAATLPETKVPLSVTYEPPKDKEVQIQTILMPQEMYEFSTEGDITAKYSANKFQGRKKEDFGIQDSYNKSTDLYLTVNRHVNTVGDPVPSGGGFRGGIFYPKGRSARRFSTGGIVKGGAQLITVAEEGSPEMVIPLSSQRRERGLKLWEKAGHMLGVPGFATGGIVGNADEGIRNMQYDSGDGGAGGQTVQVEVGGITIEIQVNGNESGNISEAIRAQANDIADTVAGVLVEAFRAQFANTPTRGGVA